jgi:hypothetical protein
MTAAPRDGTQLLVMTIWGSTHAARWFPGMRRWLGRGNPQEQFFSEDDMMGWWPMPAVEGTTECFVGSSAAIRKAAAALMQPPAHDDEDQNAC